MLAGDTKYSQIAKETEDFCSDLTKKLRDPSLQMELKMNIKSQKFATYFSGASNEAKVKTAFLIQKQIRIFLKNYTLSRFKNLCQSKVQSFQYIDEICDLWENYQRFVYGLKFFAREAQNSFKGFYKIANKFQTILTSQQNKDNQYRNYKNQVAHVPVMAVNQLKQFLQFQRLLDPLIGNFVKIFCTFMKQQRQGINTPQDKINDVLGFFQSIHLDYECDCIRRDQKIRIIKHVSQLVPVNRRSSADSFFEKTFTKFIFIDCQNYYKNWVDTKSINIPAGEQIKQMLNYLDKEQNRAKFYIHDPKNELKYINIVETNLLQYKLDQRLRKSTGLKYFLSSYQLDKPEMVEEINNFWRAYKRIYSKENKAKQIIHDIYQTYLRQQAITVSLACEKASQFIQQSVKLNKKNLQIVKMLGGILQFDRIRVDELQNLLSMKYIEQNKKQKIKYHFGAKHWAAYLNSRLKVKYGKTQKYNENDADLLLLFKVMVCKNTVLEEHQNHLNQRLLDDLDMGLQAHYANAMDLQQKVLDQMKKQSSENDLKAIQGCLKDIQTSLDLRNNLRSSVAMKKFAFFNQIIRKTGNFWADTSKYEIQPPIILKDCLTTIRQQLNQQNLVFQLQNGTSLFTAKIKNIEYRFQLKNIYVIILLLIDEKPKKRMSFTDIARKQLRPLGQAGGRAQLQLIRALVELTEFKLLKCTRKFSQGNPNIDNWSPADQFSINQEFVPAKKLQIYKSVLLPEYLRRAFGEKFSILNNDAQKFERNRMFIVQGRCVKLLKHAQTLNAGQGTITFDQLLKGQSRQTNVDAKYLKQIIQSLINHNLCIRVEDKKNTFKYKS